MATREQARSRSVLPVSRRASFRPDPSVEVPEQPVDELGGPRSILGDVGPLGVPELVELGSYLLTSGPQQTQETGGEPKPVSGAVLVGRRNLLLTVGNVGDQSPRPLRDLAFPAGDASPRRRTGLVGHANYASSAGALAGGDGRGAEDLGNGTRSRTAFQTVSIRS